MRIEPQIAWGMCKPQWWVVSEQMHGLLRTACDQLFDTRAWRGVAVVGDDGMERYGGRILREERRARARARGFGPALARMSGAEATGRETFIYSAM